MPDLLFTNIKDEYLNQYSEYLDNPWHNTDLTIKYLNQLGPIASLWTEDLYEIYLKKTIYPKVDCFKLRTNGSSNNKNIRYEWGPNARKMTDFVWNFMHRFYKIEYKIWIYFTTDQKTYIDLDDTNCNKRCEGKISYINPYVIPQEYYSLENVAWITNPHNLSNMLQYPNVVDFLKQTTSVISITELDSSFYDFSILDENEIPYTNQMRSWKEGTSFYTCPYEKRHWTENLFYCTEDKKIIDLYNFNNTWYNNDIEESNPDQIWPLETEFKKCECGTWHRELNFRSHAYKWFYDYKGKMSKNVSFIESKLKGKYKYFQIIQREKLNIFYIHTDIDLNECDFKTIKSFIYDIYNSWNFIIENTNDPYLVGNNYKQPVFWSEYVNTQNNKQNISFKGIADD